MQCFMFLTAVLLLATLHGRAQKDTFLGPHHHNSEVLTLRQIWHHGGPKYPQLHRYVNVSDAYNPYVQDEFGQTLQHVETSFSVEHTQTAIMKPTPRAMNYQQVLWSSSNVKAPNVTDKQTVTSFAKMAANAYARKDNSSDWKWQDVGGGFNYTDDFGWENDGLRGHVFADEKNQTIVISIKGTSVAWLDDPDTTLRDVKNDNLLGSCCCGQDASFWVTPVCECRTSAYTCNNTCLTTALQTKSSYYWAAEELYYNITTMYPGADIWMTGHSLGGVISSLLGLTFGLPTITYEAYPDALAASRFGLATPPGYNIGKPQADSLHGSHVHHFGHTADPIFMGTCNGAFSYCSFWGYALEGLCHTGNRCVYDTVEDLGWSAGDVRSHSIVKVIEDVLEVYEEVPACRREVDCTDCVEWEFFDDVGKNRPADAGHRGRPRA